MRNRHSLHSTCDMRPACSATHMNHSVLHAGEVAMAYWSCDSLKVPGFVIRMSFVNGIFVYSVYGQTEFPIRKPFETEFTIFPNGKGNFLKRKIIIPTVGPRLSGHQLSGYLYYPAAILQCIMSSFHSFPHRILLKTKAKWKNLCFISFYVHFIWMIICYKYNSND